ncbi:hypothetical protein Hanom_Chr01g00048391 [Helianthus anomalus]
MGVHLGVVCFFRGKMSAVCGPHLQTSVAEEVDQTSAVCRKKTVCFLTSPSFQIINAQNFHDTFVFQPIISFF